MKCKILCVPMEKKTFRPPRSATNGWEGEIEIINYEAHRGIVTKCGMARNIYRGDSGDRASFLVAAAAEAEVD